MRMLIIYDQVGAIQSIVVPGKEVSSGLNIELQDGENAIEFDSHEIGLAESLREEEILAAAQAALREANVDVQQRRLTIPGAVSESSSIGRPMQ